MKPQHAKALKLLEALAEDCENVKRSGDHAWRRCRACLAREELDHVGIKEMLRDFLDTLLNPWQPMHTMPAKGQVLVCWSTDQFDCIGRDEYREIIKFGETEAKGWAHIPFAPVRRVEPKH